MHREEDGCPSRGTLGRLLGCLVAFAVLGLAVPGCATRASDFRGFVSYLGRTPPDTVLGSEFLVHWRPVCEPFNDAVPFLLRKSESADPKEAVSAYVALSELAYWLREARTRQADTMLTRLRCADLAARFQALPPTALADPWAKWLVSAEKVMQRSMAPVEEQPHGVP